MYGNLLMVGNFSSGTGYAWKMIAQCFIAVGNYFQKNNKDVILCFPKVDKIPDSYSSSKFKIIEFDFNNAKLIDVYYFLIKHQIKYIYLIDQPYFSLRYVLLRIAGIKCLIIHDHSSGARDTPCLIKGLMKFILNRLRLFSADHIIAISDFVRQRAIRVGKVPSNKVSTILNGIDVEDFRTSQQYNIYKLFGIERDRKIIFCGCRANFYKGVDIFIKTARELINRRHRHDLFFLYCGDGPDFAKIKSMIREFNLTEFFCCPGEVKNINHFLSQVFVCVVPSVWEEGFGMIVIEGMAAGVPVIASKVGGMAEIIEDKIDGFYVEPGRYSEIADLIESLYNEKLHSTISQMALKHVKERYNFKQQQKKIVNLFSSYCNHIV